MCIMGNVKVTLDSWDPDHPSCVKKRGSSHPQIVHKLRLSGVWNYH